MRPDHYDYLCYKEYPLPFKTRMRTYLRDTKNQVKSILQGWLESDKLRSGNHLTHFDIAVVELGFIFDVVYTKTPLIYTWKGCILRLISFTLSIGTLLFFIFQLSFGGLMLNKIEPRDVFLTMCMLVETVALDICSVLSNLCSDWGVIFMYDKCSAPKILQYALQYFPCFLSQQKERSAWMGQFDLLDYCWNSRMVGVYRFLQKHCSGDILENCLRSKHTKFVEVPSSLKPKEVYQSRLDSFFVSSDSFEATRGQRTLVELGERISDIRADLECSIKIHFDASIIVWHLATSICYHQDLENPNNASNEAMKISKYLSDYMMHLLVMRPAMLLTDDCPSSSLDCALNELTVLISEASNKVPISEASNKDAAVYSLLQDLPEISADTAMEDLSNISGENGMKNLPKYAGYLATKLNRNGDKWELIKAMWIEMLLYAAHSDQYINNVRQLAEYGREFISIIWVMGSYSVIREVIEEDCVK
ncbi:hypothetical protein SLEP1_g37875 [Rubroshorea leprosula]|nr:hypothetical protein SLEP1_g37875 [Rubroshorea leprosula]